MTSPLEQLPNTYRAFFSGFSSLTTAQKQLIQPILRGEDVILQASTGAGKTEAVLAPASEKLLTHPGYFTIIYIVPTRALALDMNRRIKPIYQKLGLKAGMRTGDGKHLRDGKPHLLIMTPESLDVLLGSMNQNNKHFLKHVHMMIIDEVHVFLHSDRGRQLAYLRHRLALQSTGSLQTVALSATIDNAEDVTRFFNLHQTPFYYKQSVARVLQPHWVHIEDEEGELVSFFNDLYSRSGCKKLLVFANSRKKCEQLYGILNPTGFFAQTVFVHYSNLSTQERKLIEAAFRKEKLGVCIATSTLELGIDMGDVDGVVLMGPPPSTMAFLQRIGRGNRRQQHNNFWGICYGPSAGIQLVRFLAFFALAQEHSIEKCGSSAHYSVLFQQILSCLYAKKIVSKESLCQLFKESDVVAQIVDHMVATHWLQALPVSGMYGGGWRYFAALKRQKIWSNFPPTDDVYDVILGCDKIAELPLFLVEQLEIGALIRLTGRVLKVLRIEEKRAALEVWVEESRELDGEDLTWVGLGPPVSFEVAQKMVAILLDESNREQLPGLLKRTRQLLEKEREKIARSFAQPSGMRVHVLEQGMYRYETFLGSTANRILYHLVKEQFASSIEGLTVSFDELGLESNEWIPFELLKIPHTIEQLQEWIFSHASFLRGSCSWNSWLYWLPEKHQLQEMTFHLYDPRVLAHFQKYATESQWLPLPISYEEEDPTMVAPSIELKGEPWSLEHEKNAWGTLTFPDLPLEVAAHLSRFSATQVQGYVTQKLCPRWARFQRVGFQVQSHSRFSSMDQELQSRRQQGITFQKEVIEALHTHLATATWSWQQAIRTVAFDGQPLVLARPRLELGKSLSGNPDLIFIQHRGSHICLEVWESKLSPSISYAQKWKIAFYAYLLENLMRGETFALPVKVSALGVLIYPSSDQDKRFEKTSFALAPYRTWMPRLIANWQTDSERSSSIQEYAMEESCTSCRYFSYCYQEVLLAGSMAPVDQTKIISRNKESNDFPKNSQHWYFILYDKQSIRWQCWENGETVHDVHIRLQDCVNEAAFQEGVANQLHKQWTQSARLGKHPHFLVYEQIDWFLFQAAFQSTLLPSLWAMHVSWTSIQTVLQTHFVWPVPGRLTSMQVGACLGLTCSQMPSCSLYHRESVVHNLPDLNRQIWSWCLANVKSRRVVVPVDEQEGVAPLIRAYLALHHRETEYRMADILEFQKNPLSHRVQQFRAIGPIRFLGNKGELYKFSIETKSEVSKFRVGDFLKLSPVGNQHIQEGFSVLLDTYLPEQGILSVRPLHQRLSVSRNRSYALDEDATDWNAPKITKVLHLLKNPKFCPEVMQLLLGHAPKFSSDAIRWVEQWYPLQASSAGLNHLQQRALMLPFREKVGLIEGPPGTGKTHLLVWTLIALVAHAQSFHRQVKILVTAQTHHAIDQILRKTATALLAAGITHLTLWKYGRFDAAQFSQLGIEQMQDAHALYDRSSLILGATGFGVYQLLEDKQFPQLFDWVVFDEASQVLAPYACLSLLFGKGQALFYGDTQQLSPIVKGNYEHTSFVPRSILQELISRYGPQNRQLLNETYRMNAEICAFASRQWYEDKLRSAVAKQKLELPNYPLFRDPLDDFLDPSQSLVIVQLDHLGSLQSSLEEAQWIAKAVKRLMEDYSVSAQQIGIISPHRLQNNTILSALKVTLPFSLQLPRVDTVERMQGAEFDIVIFSATVSDAATIHSPFLKEYRRLNVALTRARKKFLFVASTFFFQAFPRTEKELIAQMPFEDLVAVSGATLQNQ